MKPRELSNYSVKTNGLVSMSISDIDTNKRTVMGVGNAYNFLDSQLDILTSGASKNSIKLNGPESDSIEKIAHAFNHNLNTLPGKITKLEEREVNIKGENVMCLCFESKLSDTQLGNELLAQYLDGTYNQHSIGFKYLKYQFLDPQAHGNSEDGKAWNKFKDSIMNLGDYDAIAGAMPDWMPKQVLKVDEIKLYEISTVAFGANKLTPYLGNKSGNPESLALMINNRLKQLHECVKKGLQNDSAVHNLKLQILQIESMMDEIFSDFSVKEFLRTENKRPDIEIVNNKSDNNLFWKELFS